MKKAKVDLIKNVFLSNLSTVEELLIEIELIFEKRERIFLKIKKQIDEKEVMLKISKIKKVLKDLKKEFNIKEEEMAETAIVNSRCAKIWEILNDLKSEKLKRYGEIPKDLGIILDPKIEEIIYLINEIVDMAAKKR
ncbi:MAG: hypothetical protein NC922_00915 [Candidatus Omnitrophica bacterium]|nr:hypothetical protein [Candidatus Omnitrophota bacterium]